MQPRKLIAHGPSSLTAALPHQWIKKNSLKKGDIIAIEEDEAGLHITAKPTTRQKSTNLNITGYDWPAILTILTTVYRRGYDEVRVRFGNSEEYQHLSSAVRSLLGFAIVENAKGRCVIQSLPDSSQDFTTLFRRVFLILLQQLDDLIEALDDPETLKNFYQRDADVNAIVNLAIRLINKGYIQDRFQELHLFHALLVLEEMGDDITRFTIEAQTLGDGSDGLSKFSKSNKHSKDSKSKKDPKVNDSKFIDSNFYNSQNLKDPVKGCAKMLRMLYEAHFAKSGNIMEFYRQYYLYWTHAAPKKNAPLYDLFTKESRGKPVFYLRSIVEKTIQLAEILLMPEAASEIESYRQ